MLTFRCRDSSVSTSMAVRWGGYGKKTFEVSSMEASSARRPRNTPPSRKLAERKDVMASLNGTDGFSAPC